MLTKVLVPLDGSDLAEGILPYISQMAKGLNIRLLLLSVVDPGVVRKAASAIDSASSRRTFEPPAPLGGGPYASATYHASAADLAEMTMRRRLEKVIERLKGEGVQAEAEVAVGKPADEILRIASERGCDLIAMSTHGRTPVGRAVMGSVTDRVVHASHLPTLTITPDRAKKYWQAGEKLSGILVPLDGSPLAESVLPFVEELARMLSLEVVLVRVIETAGVRPASDMMVPAIDPEAEADAINYLKVVAKRLKTKEIDVQWKVLQGGAAESLARLAHDLPKDIIVIASHGRTGVRRLVMGSVADALVRASGDPVLVFRPQKAAA